ncbi:YceD family protein [Thiovibrio sp. JS02]
MQVRFDEIPEDGLWLNVPETSWLPAEVAWQGEVRSTIFLGRNGERVVLEGDLNLTLLFECDRCLEQFSYPLETRFRIDFELLSPGEEQSFAGEHECSREEMDVVYLDEPLIDIYAVLAQQLYLALPEKRLCNEECHGLCPGCGVNLNTQQCACSRESGSSPFSVLAKLKH